MHVAGGHQEQALAGEAHHFGLHRRTVAGHHFAAIADGSLATLAPLTDLVAKLKANGGTCHLLGLVSPGGVHSHQAHIAALARSVAAAGVPVAAFPVTGPNDVINGYGIGCLNEDLAQAAP